jgi:hypothetical protein
MPVGVADRASAAVSPGRIIATSMTVLARSTRPYPGWLYPVLALIVSLLVTMPFLEYAFPDRQQSLLTTYFNPGLGTFHQPFDLLYRAVLVVLFCYLLLAIRFMHQRLLVARSQVPIATDQPGLVFDKAFRWANSLVPPLGLAIAVAGAYLVLFFADGQTIDLSFAPMFVLDALFATGRELIVFTFVWVYLASLYGLHSLARQPLVFRRHHEDRLLGMRAFGSLSLSLAVCYFVGLALGFLLFELASADPVLYTSKHDPAFVLAAALVASGVALFFLPLRAVHAKMEHEKRRERERLDAWYGTLFAGEPPAARSEDMETTLREVRNIAAFQIMERHVEAIHTWPFDTKTLGFLLTSLALPLLLTLIASVTLELVHIRPAI